MSRRYLRMFVLAGAALFAGLAFAQSAPTIDQVYQAAQAGRVDEAQQMMKQVLRDHPTSAKAHYVEAELSARQGKLDDARRELATAETLAPGLPFAKPAAVSALRSELSAAPAARRSTGANVSLGEAAGAGAIAPAAAVAPASSSFNWGIAFAVVAGIAFIVVMLRRRTTAPSYAQAPMAYGGAQPVGAPGYGPGPGYGPAGGPGYAPAPSAGSGIMGGLATGLAVGAGVVAAEQIGRRMFGSEHERAASLSSGDNNYVPVDQNPGMGGNDFGIADAGSWDDGGGSGGSDGGGWDS